jgi:hypothetical protein
VKLYKSGQDVLIFLSDRRVAALEVPPSMTKKGSHVTDSIAEKGQMAPPLERGSTEAFFLPDTVEQVRNIK